MFSSTEKGRPIDAVAENSLPDIRRLLGAGADANAKDDEGSRPLHEASFRGHVQVVKDLLEHVAEVEEKDNDDWTALHFACINGHLAVVNELASHGAEILTKNDSNGATTTTTTILGKPKSRGVDIDVKTSSGDTPLHMASVEGCLVIVKSLLAVGANILAANNDGQLPIHQAVSQGKSEVSKCLLQQLYATTRRLPFHELLEDLTWIGIPFRSDAPPLRYALDEYVLDTDDVVEILEYLVGQKPALLSSLDQDGALPLHVACRRGASFPIVQSLVNLYKASVKSLTPQGDLPLFLACELPEPSLDTIFLLIKQDPEVVYR
jgi:ankyrin repeat protein